MHCIHTNIQRLHFKNQLIGAAQSQQQLWVTLFLWFFMIPPALIKSFIAFKTADVSGTGSVALLSEGQQTHPAATETRKHIIYGFSYLPKNRKIKQLQEWFIQIQTADTQVMEISKRNTLFDNVESFPAAFVGISPLHSLKTTTATVPSQQSDVSRATTTAFRWEKFTGSFSHWQNLHEQTFLCAHLPHPSVSTMFVR